MFVKKRSFGEQDNFNLKTTILWLLIYQNYRMRTMH